MYNSILVKNNLVALPKKSKSKVQPDVQILATLNSNLLYYGYVLSAESLSHLASCSTDNLKTWWTELEAILKEVTGDSKEMDQFVVYKNFPQEVLDMTQAEYWFNQICMYIGCPNEWFATEAKPRDSMFEKLTLKVLHKSDNTSLSNIYEKLIKLPCRWTSDQQSQVTALAKHFIYRDLGNTTFKENLVVLAAEAIQGTVNVNITLNSATDVLRLGLHLSGGDITFKTKTKFKSFSRSLRRKLLSMLDSCSNLEEDMARDKNRWKKFMKNLHPNDFGTHYKNVTKIYNKLYNNKIYSWNSGVELAIQAGDESVLELLAKRPGEFMRRLHHMISTFNKSTIATFIEVLPKLKTVQLLKIRKYLNTINDRKFLTFAPKGNWGKLQVVENKKNPLDIKSIAKIDKIIGKLLKSRIEENLTTGVKLDSRLDLIKLQTSDSELAPYGRGTVFNIPENITFLRSASYWAIKSGYNVWYDNGWLFYNKNWDASGSCCWTDIQAFNNSAIFSGDPTNSKNKDGRACQMIDLYIDKLLAKGIRYAVWNILCYSRIPFDSADVFATLQWGEDAKSGKLFEPSRCQLAFPLKGQNMSKYIAYIDLEERKLIYMDANLKGQVNTASSNLVNIGKVMPAYVEYLNTLPSVADLFNDIKSKNNGVPICYSDENFEIKDGQAYVFKPINQNNQFKQLNLSKLL